MPIAIIWQALRFAGVASMGYFVNDVSTFLGGIFKVEPNAATKSGWPWWLKFVSLVVLGLAAFFIIRLINPRAKL